MSHGHAGNSHPSPTNGSFEYAHFTPIATARKTRCHPTQCVEKVQIVFSVPLFPGASIAIKQLAAFSPSLDGSSSSSSFATAASDCADLREERTLGHDATVEEEEEEKHANGEVEEGEEVLETNPLYGGGLLPLSFPVSRG